MVPQRRSLLLLASISDVMVRSVCIRAQRLIWGSTFDHHDPLLMRRFVVYFCTAFYTIQAYPYDWDPV
jgi:hypothetical protein